MWIIPSKRGRFIQHNNDAKHPIEYSEKGYPSLSVQGPVRIPLGVLALLLEANGYKVDTLTPCKHCGRCHGLRVEECDPCECAATASC